MINTIFYFANNQAEYLDNWNRGEVKPHTIVFVKDTQSIWKNGVRYSGFTEDEIKQIIELETEDINAAIELINHTIDEINLQANEEKDRLDGVIDHLNSEIQDKIEDLFADSQWIQNNQPKGLVVPYDMSWDNNIQAYLQRVGLWDYNDASIVTKWSTIRLSLNSIQSDVNSITETGGTLDLLQSKITQEVTDRGDAITNLGNTYARITDVDGVKDVIEWMYSGLKSGSGADKSYAEIMAAGKNGMNSAISDLRTSVENIGNTYVAKSSLTSAVNDAISGVVNTTTEGLAMSSMFSKIDENSDNIAAIATKVTGDSTQATVAAKLNGMTGALLTTANIDDAVAALSAQAKNDLGEDIAATIFAEANKNGSTITLNADQINIDANHQLDLSAQTVTIDADDINLNGQTNFENAIGNWITAKGLNIAGVNGQIQSVISGGNATFNGDVVANTLTAGNPNEMHITTSNGEILFVNANGVAVARFVINGNGMDLILLDSNGNPYTIDWSHWQSSVSYNTMNFYTFTSTSKNSFIKYYNSSEENNTVANRTYYDSPNTANLGLLSNYQDVYILLRTEYKNSLISGSNVLCHTFSGSNDYTGSYSTDGRSPVKITLVVGVYEKVTMSNGVLTTTGQYLYFADDWVLKVAYDYAPQQFRPQLDLDYTMSRYDTAPRKVVQQSDYTGVYFGAESRTDSYNGASYNEYVRKEGTVTDLYAPV